MGRWWPSEQRLGGGASETHRHFEGECPLLRWEGCRGHGSRGGMVTTADVNEQSKKELSRPLRV